MWPSLALWKWAGERKYRNGRGEGRAVETPCLCRVLFRWSCEISSLVLVYFRGAFAAMISRKVSSRLSPSYRSLPFTATGQNMVTHSLSGNGKKITWACLFVCLSRLFKVPVVGNVLSQGWILFDIWTSQLSVHKLQIKLAVLSCHSIRALVYPVLALTTNGQATAWIATTFSFQVTGVARPWLGLRPCAFEVYAWKTKPTELVSGRVKNHHSPRTAPVNVVSHEVGCLLRRMPSDPSLYDTCG